MRTQVRIALGALAVLVVSACATPTPQGSRATPASGSSSAAASSGQSAQFVTAPGFAQPFSAALPPWASRVAPTVALTHRMITWEQAPCTNDCPAGSDVKLRVLAPQSVIQPGATSSTTIPSYAGYLAYLDVLDSTGIATLSDRSETRADGHDVTIVTVTADADREGAMGCELPPPSTNGCWGLIAAFRIRLAVVDSGVRPLLVWSRTSSTSTQAARADEDLKTMVTSISFGTAASDASSPSPTGSGIEGTWRTTFTRDRAIQVLARIRAEKSLDIVLADFPPDARTLQLELRVGGGRYGVWIVNPDGTVSAEDDQSFSLEGQTLTADPTNAHGTRTVYTVDIQGSTMTWDLVSDESPPLAPGVPDEAIQRVLYTAGVWTRVT